MRIRGTRLVALAAGISAFVLIPTAAHAKEACVKYDFDGIVNEDNGEDGECYDYLPGDWNTNWKPWTCKEPVDQSYCVWTDFWTPPS